MSIVNKQKEEKTQKKKSTLREWFDAVVFAVVAATIIRWLFIEAFTIPTPSMEKSLLVGDFLFVSKVHYGARTPKTPLQIPLTHQKIWGTEIPSYLDWIQLPQFRLPGFSEVKNNDVVVFNYPPEVEYPVDLKTNYIKRCIGIAGDKLEIVDKKIYINGQSLDDPENVQTSYKVQATQMLSEQRVFYSRDITDVQADNARNTYYVQTNDERAAGLKTLDFIKDVEEISYDKGNGADRVFPFSGEYDWTLDNFGPVYVPKEGDKISINDSTLALYEHIILKYERNEDAKVEDGKLYIEGNAVSEYTFEQNYYFMMGDNRHNSQDSRIWGFVPADHVLGKGLLIWWSIDSNQASGNIFKRIRWNRIFKIIE